MTSKEDLNWKQRIGYGSGDFALNLFWQSTGFYLLFFYTDIIGIPNSTAGLIFAIGGFWDAISDPIVGYTAERTKTRWGNYRPYILFGTIPLAISFIIVFSSPPEFNDFWKLVYLTISLILFRTCYTIVSIPYSALGARITHTSSDRTKLAGTRMYFGFLGGITVITMAGELQKRLSDSDAFSILAWVCAALSIIILTICFKSTQENEPSKHETVLATNLKETFSAILQNKAILSLAASIVFVTITSTLVGGTLLYFFQYNLGSREAGNTAILIMIGAPLLTIPFWSFMTLKTGKRRAWMMGGLITTLGLLFLYFGGQQSIQLATISMIIITLGLSSYSVLFWSMLPDAIDYGEYISGVRNESFIVGLMSSVQKSSIALSVFALGTLLDFINYQAGAIQSDSTKIGLILIITLIPATAILISTAFVYFYPVSTKFHKEIEKALIDKF